MKIKLLTLLVAIFLLGNVSSAQGVGTFKAKKKSTVVVKKNLAPQRQGAFIMPKVGAGIKSDENGFTFNLQAVIGHEFNNHFALGVGTGFNNYILDNHYYYYYNFYHNHIEFKNRMLTISIPLYINIHGDFSKHKTTAYYSLDLGVQMPIRRAIGESVSHYYDDDYDTTEKVMMFYRGFFISPEIGIKFNSCYLGVDFTLAKIHSEFVFSNRAYNDFYFTKVLSLKFGYKILLKKVRF